MGDNEKTEASPLVTGAMIKNRTVDGRRVKVWGRISGASAPDTISLTTPDNGEVTVKLRSPAPTTDHSQWIEVTGVPRGGQLVAEDLLVFPAGSDLHLEGYQALAQLLSAVDDPWNIGG